MLLVQPLILLNTMNSISYLIRYPLRSVNYLIDYHL